MRNRTASSNLALSAKLLYNKRMDTNQKLDELNRKIEAVYVSVEKTRKYFKWTMIITLALFVLPLIGLLFAIPSFMTNYVGNIQTLSQ